MEPSFAPSQGPSSSRVSVVTGAGKGLGAAFARACAAVGDRVVVNNRIQPGASDDAGAVADAIVRAGGQAVADRSDIADPGAGARIVETAMNAFGRLDAVIFNAGISGPAVKFDGVDPEVFDEVLAINFFANIRLAKAAMPALETSPAGRLVFVSSSAGLYGVKGRAAYAASKGALNAFALTLADELRKTRVRVNVLAPYADTRMTAGVALDAATKAQLAPERASAAAAWLASADCDRTGEIWIAGAGWLRRARVVETRGAAILAGDVEASARAAEADPTPQSFKGGEAAFADFLKTASEAAP